MRPASICKFHLVAYGVELWLPKHHFVSHLGNQLARHKILPSCFLMERKHRQIKRFAAPRRTGTAFEAGLMEEVTCQHLYDLHTPVGGCGLYEPHAAPDCIVSALNSVLFIHPLWHRDSFGQKGVRQAPQSVSWRCCRFRARWAHSFWASSFQLFG